MQDKPCEECVRLKKQVDAAAGRGLTLATLCDMILGEGPGDRSDDYLIRRTRMLIDRCDELEATQMDV